MREVDKDDRLTYKMKLKARRKVLHQYKYVATGLQQLVFSGKKKQEEDGGSREKESSDSCEIKFDFFIGLWARQVPDSGHHLVFMISFVLNKSMALCRKCTSPLFPF